jgi:hypothetical protein
MGILILVIQEIKVLMSGDSVGTIGRDEGPADAAGSSASGKVIAVVTSTGGDEPFSPPSSASYPG